MNRAFCDVCDKPAVNFSSISGTINMPEKVWSGYQTGSGGSGCDGRWTPEVWILSHFKAQHLRKDDYREKQPDLCLECMIMLCQKQLDALKEKRTK